MRSLVEGIESLLGTIPRLSSSVKEVDGVEDLSEANAAVEDVVEVSCRSVIGCGASNEEVDEVRSWLWIDVDVSFVGVIDLVSPAAVVVVTDTRFSFSKMVVSVVITFAWSSSVNVKVS